MHNFVIKNIERSKFKCHQNFVTSKVHWVRSTSAKTKGLDYSLRLNLDLRPNIKTEFDFTPAIWSKTRLKSKLWSKPKG